MTNPKDTKPLPMTAYIKLTATPIDLWRLIRGKL